LEDDNLEDEEGSDSDKDAEMVDDGDEPMEADEQGESENSD